MIASTQAKPRAAKVSVRKLAYLTNDPSKQLLEITGYSGSAKTLKRLVEIAGMDYEDAFVWLSNDGYSYSEARLICSFLGLSSARGGRK